MPRTAKPPVAGVTAAIIYYRVSGDEQEREGQSLAAQLADCRRYCAAHGWVIAHERQDVMTGKRDDRPSYQALLTDARRMRAEGQGVVVVVKWLHRLGRRLSERVRCWEELAQLGVPIHSVAEGGQQQEFVFNVLAAVAQEESRQLGERISSSWRHITSQGWPKIGRVPWGYRLRDATPAERATGSTMKVLDIDSETAPYVEEMFRRASTAPSARSVAVWVARLPAHARGGRELEWGSVQLILRNPLYVARPVEGDDPVLGRPAGRWPALVTDDLWEAVQTRSQGHRRLAHQATRKYLLTGLLKCSACGRGMRGEPSSHGSTRYRCYGSTHAQCQETVSWNVDCLVLDQAKALLDNVASDPFMTARVRQARRAHERAEDADSGKRVRALDAQLQRSRQRIARATELLVDGTIDRPAYDDLILKARGDSEAAQVELDALRRPAPSQPTLTLLKEFSSPTNNWATMLADGDVAVRRDILSKLIERVVAVRQRWNTYDVTVTWTPFGQLLQ